MSGTHRTCEICGIKERHCEEKRFYVRFPRDKYRCAEWVKVIGNEDLAYLSVDKLHGLKHVCGIHFAKRDLTKSKKRLKKSAVPKLHLSTAPVLSDDVIDEFIRINSDEAIPPVNQPLMPANTFIVTASSSKDKHNVFATASTSKACNISEISCEPQLPMEYVKIQLDDEIVPIPSVTQQMPASAVVSQRVPTVDIEHEDKIVAIASTSKAANVLELSHVAAEVPVIVKALTPIHPDLVKTQHSKENVLEVNRLLTKGTKRKLNDEIAGSPNKRKLLMQLKKTKCTLKSLKKSANIIENLSSPFLKEIVLSALKNQRRKPQGKRWTMKNKISALAIYKRSPKAYRYMQHIMPLPSIKTLQNILKKYPMDPGINAAVISHLKKIGNNLKPCDKLCTIAFDEIALKERLTYNVARDKVEGFVDFGSERKGEQANHALVFMLQGVGKKIKQPLAYYFVNGTVSSEKLAVIVKDVIREVKSAGFRVLSTICDQGPTNLGALRLLKEWHNGGGNYFEIDGKKVFFIFDVPHLFKSIRNNFLQQGSIKMDGKIGKWSHLVEVEEQNRSFLYLSKITPTHVQPKYRAKMRVKYAVQILSQTVAVVLKLLAKSVDNTDRSAEILETALIVEDLNRLFDYTNGPSSPDDTKKGIRENVSAKTKHIEVWMEFKKKLSTTKFVDRTGIEAKKVKCIEGYIMTLDSLIDIWNILKEEGYKYMNLRQLNQDALENLFGIIRQHSPTNRHPTCSTFVAALKTSIISGMTAPHSSGFNCEKDGKSLLTNFQDIVFGTNKEENNDDEDVIIEVENEPPVLTLPEDIEDVELESDLTEITEQPLVYVSGYIASRVMKKIDCQNCKNALTVEDPAANPVYELIKLKEWWQGKQSLTYPSVNLCRMVEKALQSFEMEGISNLHIINVSQWVITLFYANCHTTWLQCDVHAKIIVQSIFEKLAILFVRRQCQRINIQKSLKEENLSDAYKKGQQYGTAK